MIEWKEINNELFICTVDGVDFRSICTNVEGFWIVLDLTNKPEITLATKQDFLFRNKAEEFVIKELEEKFDITVNKDKKINNKENNTMTSRDFCYWLQGFFEVSEAKTLNTKQLQQVKNHLNMVFKHEIDPSMGNQEHQEELNSVHTFGKWGSSENIRC